MVCEKCEKKLEKVIVPDVWKDGARNTNESGGRKMGGNTLLGSKSKMAKPYTKNSTIAKCKTCKRNVMQGLYCNNCSYKEGMCSMCGVKTFDTKLYRQSTV